MNKHVRRLGIGIALAAFGYLAASVAIAVVSKFGPVVILAPLVILFCYVAGSFFDERST